MRLSRLKKKVMRQAGRGRRNGSLSEAEYAACVKVVESREGLVKLNEQVEAEVNPWNRADGLKGDFKEWLANLWDWFQEHWPEILALILKLAPLLLILENNDDEDR